MFMITHHFNLYSSEVNTKTIENIMMSFLSQNNDLFLIFSLLSEKNLMVRVHFHFYFYFYFYFYFSFRFYQDTGTPILIS